MPTTNEICTRDGYYTCSRCGERQMVLHDDKFPVCSRESALATWTPALP